MIVDFCLPAKNEESILKDNVNSLLRFLESKNLSYDWKIILAINGSTDDSINIARDLAHSSSHIEARIIEKPGKSRALKECFSSSTADLLMMMDVDLSASLNDIDTLLNPLLNNEADLVIGSRYLPHSDSRRSVWRKFVSYSYNSLSRYVLNHDFQDLQCGFKAMRRQLFNSLEQHLIDNDWFLDTELVILADRLGFRVKEVPIEWKENYFRGRKTKIRMLKDIKSFIKAIQKFSRYLKENDIKK